MTSLVLLLTLSLLAAPAWAQDVPDIPDLGPPRPHFDPKKHCKCLDQYIKKIRGQIAAYRELATAYEADARAFGAKGQPARWVDPGKLSPDERRVLRSLNSEFDEKERANNERASSTDECGFPDGDIILKTSALTGQPPSKDDQQREKPKFAFEELYDAVMVHEYFHAGQWETQNGSRPAGSLPKARTPYERALEEAEGYEKELAHLEPLKNKCKQKVTFRGVSLISRGPHLVMTRTISGEVCGDPLTDSWTIRAHNKVVAAGYTRESDDKPWLTDCLEKGGDLARSRESLFLNGPGGWWYCLYEPGKPASAGKPAAPPKVTIRMPRLDNGPIRFEGPNDHAAETTVGPCDEKPQAPPKPSPSPRPGLPVSDLYPPRELLIAQYRRDYPG